MVVWVISWGKKCEEVDRRVFIANNDEDVAKYIKENFDKLDAFFDALMVCNLNYGNIRKPILEAMNSGDFDKVTQVISDFDDKDILNHFWGYIEGDNKKDDNGTYVRLYKIDDSNIYREGGQYKNVWVLMSVGYGNVEGFMISTKDRARAAKFIRDNLFDRLSTFVDTLSECRYDSGKLYDLIAEARENDNDDDRYDIIQKLTDDDVMKGFWGKGDIYGGTFVALQKVIKAQIVLLK